MDVVVLVVSGSSSLLATQEDVILIQNYGVVFQTVGIENGADVWHHTFAIPLTSLRPRLKRLRTCPPHEPAVGSLADFCKHFEEASAYYNKLHTNGDYLTWRDPLQNSCLVPRPRRMLTF